MTNSNTDKKIGRKKAGTWGRTSGGYSPAAAKQSKRAGSKGARKVAKDNLRNIREYGEHEAKKTIEKRKLRKKLEKVAPWMAKGLKEDYSDSKKNKYQLYSDKNDHHKAHDEIHKAVTHKSGNPKHMNAAMKKHSKHGASDTASREAIVGHFMKHHADKKGKTWSVKESSEAVSGKHLDSYLKQKELTGDQIRLLKSKKKMTAKEALDYLDIPEEKYPQSLLLKGDKDAAKKSKAERQDDKQRKLERAKHDTGGFRISDSDAKKAKERLKKKYGKFARHFREFNDLQELSPETLTRYMSKKLSKTAIRDLDTKDMKSIRRAGRSMTKQTGTPIKDKSGKVVGKVHEEQKRVLESLANLTSRGIGNTKKKDQKTSKK